MEVLFKFLFFLIGAGIMIKFDDIYMLAICNDKYFNIINQKWRLNKEIIAY